MTIAIIAVLVVVVFLVGRAAGPLVVVASTEHCVAQRAQYPEDDAQDDQDGSENPEDSDIQQSAEDE